MEIRKEEGRRNAERKRRGENGKLEEGKEE